MNSGFKGLFGKIFLSAPSKEDDMSKLVEKGKVSGTATVTEKSYDFISITFRTDSGEVICLDTTESDTKLPTKKRDYLLTLKEGDTIKTIITNSRVPGDTAKGWHICLPEEEGLGPYTRPDYLLKENSSKELHREGTAVVIEAKYEFSDISLKTDRNEGFLIFGEDVSKKLCNYLESLNVGDIVNTERIYLPLHDEIAECAKICVCIPGEKSSLFEKGYILPLTAEDIHSDNLIPVSATSGGRLDFVNIVDNQEIEKGELIAIITYCVYKTDEDVYVHVTSPVKGFVEHVYPDKDDYISEGNLIATIIPEK